MRIIHEDTKLGISKVIWKFPREADPFPAKELEPAPAALSGSQDHDGHLEEAAASIAENPVDFKRAEPAIHPDHLSDMRQQIQFLQQVIDCQNQQLKTKDELIRNFQVLLKSEQDQVLKLESRIAGQIPEDTRPEKEISWFGSLKRRLMKQ